MELVPIGTNFVVVALGKTYPIKGKLKSVGFQWNAANKVWYHLGHIPTEHDELWMAVVKDYPGLGVFFRCFKCRDDVWTEIT